MSFPGLYNYVTHIEATTVPIAVITHVLHDDVHIDVLTYLPYLLMMCLLYAHVLYLLLCSRYYVPLYEGTALLMYVCIC